MELSLIDLAVCTWKNLEGHLHSLQPHGFHHPCHVIRVHLHSPNLCCCRCLSGYSRNSSGFDSNCTSLLPACLKIEQILETKSLYLHKSRDEQSLWNRNWDLGWFWADWQYWKKFGVIMSNFWGRFFHVFFWNVVTSALKSCTVSIREKKSPKTWKKTSSGLNLQSIYWRHLPARFLYNGLFNNCVKMA